MAGSSFFPWDARLTRRLPLGERYELQLIAETEILSNRLNPACTLESACSGPVLRLRAAGDLGRLTAARSARVFQFGARFRFWTPLA